MLHSIDGKVTFYSSNSWNRGDSALKVPISRIPQAERKVLVRVRHARSIAVACPDINFD